MQRKGSADGNAAIKMLDAKLVHAPELGADDFRTKPFGMRELLARIRAALRYRMPMLCERPAFRTGELTVDLSYRTVKVAGSTIKLSPKEYDPLRFLVQHAGKVLPQGFSSRN
jgi:two-component system, OmpR family, KDP operon response regulator KdpE